jgi:hypothetical protein
VRFAAGCTTTIGGTPIPADSSGPLPAPPVPVAALDGLLLSTGEINAAMGATGMTVFRNVDTTWGRQRQCL